MYKYVVLCLCVSLSGVLCDLNKEEGSACEWDGVKGKCVKETQCLTTLDTRGDPHPVCSKKDDVTIVCCTDCELFNNTRNVALTYYWKDGTKARDICLEYLDTLPYRCRDGGFYSRISKNYDEAKKCHTIGLRGIEGAPSQGNKPGAEYPYQALLGYIEDFTSVNWLIGGSIISNKYILTAAHVFWESNSFLNFVALGVEKRSDGPTKWQIHTVKRFIEHPDYKRSSYYNDIALIETKDTITFNKNVLPACLLVEAAADETAITTTFRDRNSDLNNGFTETIQKINLEKFSEEECRTAYRIDRRYKDGINYTSQMCYGSRLRPLDACKGMSGEPLLIKTQFSRCIYTVIGVSSFGKSCGLNYSIPSVYTRVAHYRPWIESVVWA